MTRNPYLKLSAAMMATTMLWPLNAAAQDIEDSDYLGTIVLRAINDGGTGSTPSEAASTAGSRVAVSPEDLPRAVTIVPSEYFEARGSRTMEETLSYTPGVVTETYGQDDRYDEYVIRGFEAQIGGTYRDGMPLRTVDWASWRTEPFSLESVNILRGPTSDLYGLNEPGGLVNGVTKRPLFVPQRELRFSLDSYGGGQVGVDVTGPLSDTTAYRFVGLLKNTGTNYDAVDTSRVYLAPSFTWQPTAETNLTVYAQYQRDDVGDSYVLVPQYGSLYPNGNGAVPPGTYTGNPDYNTIKTTQSYIGYEFDHRLTDSLSVMSRARYSTNDWVNRTEYPASFVNLGYIFGAGTPPSDVDTALITKFDVDQTLNQLSVDNALIWDFSTGGASGSVAFGIDHFSVESETSYAFGYRGEMNLYTGARSTHLAGLVPTDLPSYRKTDIRQTGLYASGYVDLGSRTKLSGGVRFDDVHYATSGYSTEFTGVTPINTSVDDRFLSANLGLGYTLRDGLLVYGSAARSFNIPPSGELITGDPLALEESQAFEIGLKFNSLDGRTGINLALFDITKKNASFDDPTSGNPLVLTQVGRQTSRGVELEAIHDFANGLSLFGNVSYIDARISGDPTYGGNTPARVPDWAASAYVQYEVPQVLGLSLGAGVRYTGARFADIANTLQMDSVTLFDASISYEWDDWRASLVARNLANTQNVAFCGGPTVAPSALGIVGADPYAGSCVYGAGREVAFTLSRRF